MKKRKQAKKPSAPSEFKCTKASVSLYYLWQKRYSPKRGKYLWMRVAIGTKHLKEIAKLLS